MDTNHIPKTLTVEHSAGFFSCCNVLLEKMIQYVNQYHVLPEKIDSVGLFTWYKPTNIPYTTDIMSEYFTPLTISENIYQENKEIRTTDKPVEYQFVNYQFLNFKDVQPLVTRYFSPSLSINTRISTIQTKYKIDFEQTCVLFHRGNDKVKEINIPSYDQYIQSAKSLLRLHPNLRFLIQSDETEFLDQMKLSFPDNHVIFYDEIRHIPSNATTTVDRVFFSENFVMSKNFLAITYIMSKCTYVICNSGNCSLWIALFRGNADNIIQFNYRCKNP